MPYLLCRGCGFVRFGQQVQAAAVLQAFDGMPVGGCGGGGEGGRGEGATPLPAVAREQEGVHLPTPRCHLLARARSTGRLTADPRSPALPACH